MLEGDLLIQVDETLITTTLAIEDVMGLMSGEPNTQVILVVKRRTTTDIGTEILNFEMTRVKEMKPSMEWRILTEEAHRAPIGYIQQFHFTDHSPEEMEQALHELVTQGRERRTQRVDHLSA